MPWCQRCDRFLNPNTVTVEGTCPTCGRTVERAAGVGSRATEPGAPPPPPPQVSEPGDASHQPDPTDEDADAVTAPWHFWVMIGAAVLYLGWRLLEGVVWAVGQLF